MKTVYQLVPGFSVGDAISNEVLQLDRLVRAHGYHSCISAWPEHTHSDLRSKASNALELKPQPTDLLIYHHSIGSEVAELYRKANCRKWMIYHNITPADFVRPYNERVAEELERGRKQLADLKDVTEFAFADSNYNRRELEEMGYSETAELPILLDFGQYSQLPDPQLGLLLDDSKVTLLFVGRIVPNKCPHDLIKAFAIYQKYINPNSRLCIAGSYGGFEVYYHQLKQMIRELDLRDVIITGHIPFDHLLACYNRADLFLSASEHEGFCVPIVEAFHFDVPVIAYNAAAVSGTVGDAGILFYEKDWIEVAELIDTVATDHRLRNELIERGRRRIEEKFSKNRVSEIFLSHLQGKF